MSANPKQHARTTQERDITGTCVMDRELHIQGNRQAWLAQGVAEDEEEEATPIETDANSAEVTEILRCHLNCSTNCYTTI